LRRLCEKKDIKMLLEKCPAKDLVFILPAINTNVNKKTLITIANTDDASEKILTAKVLKYGQSINKVRDFLIEHIPKCQRCHKAYSSFLREQLQQEHGVAHEYGLLELDKEYLGILD